MASLEWANLPSIIIVEILSYLNNRDKLSAGGCCKSWRDCLFLPSNWKRMKFVINSAHPQENWRSKYLAKKCVWFVRTAVLELDSRCPSDVHDTLEVLEILSQNHNLQKVSLYPTSCRLECRDRSVIDRYIEILESIMKNSKKLAAISFGCVEELLEPADSFLQLLGQHQSHTLQSLHISSVKEDSEGYVLANIRPHLFNPFIHLQDLSLDYDYLNDELLEIFAKPQRAPLQRLVIHVHSVEMSAGYQTNVLSNCAWHKLSLHSPRLEVSLILLHSLHGPEALLYILQPSMRLVHFHQYFCGEIHMEAINIIAQQYPELLQSLVIVDSLDNGKDPWSYNAPDEDPFVMLAWRCKKLTQFTLIGYRVFHENIVAIARLRGSQLQYFEVPDCCIRPDDDDPESVEESATTYQTMINEVSQNLKRPWKPIPDNELHHAVVDLDEDADIVYMPRILKNQLWL